MNRGDALKIGCAAVMWVTSTLGTLPARAGALVIASPAFDDGGGIPPKYTCDGENVVPPLSWHGVPAGTKSLALIVDDPDVPDPAAPKRTWVHWVVYDIPPGADGIAEGGEGHGLPPGSKQGLNDWRRQAYGGPCPPIGRHRYFHKLYALDVVLTDVATPTKAELEAAMKGHVLDSATLIGTYRRVEGKPVPK